MMNIFKIQLHLIQPKKTILIMIVSTFCFACLTIYMSYSPFTSLFSENITNFITNKLSLAYLSLISITGSLTFLSFNGFIEDTSIFMSLVARKINIFYFIITKFLASFIYSIFTILVALFINMLFLQLPLIETLLLIISQHIVFFIIYLISFILYNEKNFDLILAYTLIIVCILSVMIHPVILFMISLPIFIYFLYLLYFKANSIIMNSIFKTNENIFDYVSILLTKFTNRMITAIIKYISKYISNNKFLAIFNKDLYSFVSFIPKFLLIHLSLIIVTSEYKLIAIICFQLIIFNFLRKLIYEDINLISLKLISYKNLIIYKSLILNFFNLICLFSFSYVYPINFVSIIVNIISITLLVNIIIIYNNL